MRGLREAEEVNEVNVVKEKNHRVAAFFDLDGTLVAMPSLERRFFRMLRYRQEIPTRNYFLWLKEAMRLIPGGISAVLQGDKMYLRDVKVFDESGEGDGDVSSWHKSGHQAGGQASLASPPHVRRMPVPTFFAQAIERVVWHAKRGHTIVLLSGTLEPLAREAAGALETEITAREAPAKIRVIATRLEAKGGRWTGRVSGEAMFGEAKVRAATRLAMEMGLDLRRCFAYGDSLNDRWLMAEVGRPAAVNPSNELARIAREFDWPILEWGEKEIITQRRPDPAGTGAVHRGIAEKKKQHAVIAG